jgi:hypothetical protein
VKLETTRDALANSVTDLVHSVQAAGQSASWDFLEGSPGRVDWETNEQANDRDQQPLQDAYRTGSLYWNLVSDQALALAELIQNGRTIGLLSESRALAESSSRMWYLLAPDLPATERIRRVVNDRLSALFEDWRMSKDEARLDATWQPQVRDSLVEAYSKAGFTVARQLGSSAAHLGEPRPSSMALLGILIGHTASAALFYRRTSAIAHAGLHGVIRQTDLALADDGTYRGRLTEPTTAEVTADISPSVVALAIASKTLITVAGWSTSEYERADRMLYDVLTALLDEEPEWAGMTISRTSL